MVTRQVKQTIREKPAWEGRAREAARQLGVSEAKVIRQVKRELIRSVAEQIAKDEHQRVQAERYAHRSAAPARPSRASKAKVRRKTIVVPTDGRPRDGGDLQHPDQSSTVPSFRNPESTMKNGVSMQPTPQHELSDELQEISTGKPLTPAHEALLGLIAELAEKPVTEADGK